MAVIGQSLDGLDARSLHLDGQHEATVDRHAAQCHRTAAAVAVVAALLGPGQTQGFAEDFQQALPWLAKELDRFAVDRGCDVGLPGHGGFLKMGPEWQMEDDK
jgi:hypothetical protein